MVAPTNQPATSSSNEPEASNPSGLSTIPPPTVKIGPYQTNVLGVDIAADSDVDDDDSAIGGFPDVSSLVSARSSAYEYVTGEDGRKYHKFREGKYIIPNDETEQDRLNLQHLVWLATLHNQLSLVPLKKEPEHVLDVGTGSGIWALEYAVEHPTSKVVGTDLSSIQPEYVPVNCSFEVKDLDDDWIYPQKFDLIHGRALVPSISNPKHFFEQAFAALAPSGFIEMHDVDFFITSADGSATNTAIEKWNLGLVAGINANGHDMGNTKNYKHWMAEVGCVDVTERIFYWPINTWPKDPYLKKVGLLFREDLLQAVGGITMPLTAGLGMTLQELNAFREEVKKDIVDRRIHGYCVIRVVIGMKPETL